MFYAVILKQSKKKLVVPEKNVKDHERKLVINFKFGIKNAEDYIIFCSPVYGNNPHFDQHENLKDEFDELEDGYYLANVLRVFGKYSIQLSFNRRYILFSSCLLYLILTILLLIIDNEEAAEAYIKRKREVLPICYGMTKRVLTDVNEEIDGHIQSLKVKMERHDHAIKSMQNDMQIHGVTIIIEDSDEE